MTLYRAAFDHLLTRTDPERAHHAAFRAIRAGRPVTGLRRTPGSPVPAMGLTFPNVLGLAAGFDKNAVGIDAGEHAVEQGAVRRHARPDRFAHSCSDRTPMSPARIASMP